MLRGRGNACDLQRDVSTLQTRWMHVKAKVISKKRRVLGKSYTFNRCRNFDPEIKPYGTATSLAESVSE